jgi:toxin ParE1/3/4
VKVIFSELAEKDLGGVFSYINSDLNNPIAARNIVDKILSMSRKLSDFPELGTNLKITDAKLDGYRYLILDNYLIVYKVLDREVYVLRILYARSDYVKLLQG